MASGSPGKKQMFESTRKRSSSSPGVMRLKCRERSSSSPESMQHISPRGSQRRTPIWKREPKKDRSGLTVAQRVTEPQGDPNYPKASEGGPSCGLDSEPSVEDILSGPLPSTSGAVGEDQQDLELDPTVTQTVTEPQGDSNYPKASEGGPSCGLDSKPSVEDNPSGPLPSTSGAVGEDQQDLELGQEDGTQCTSIAPLRFHSRCGRNAEVKDGGEVLERKKGLSWWYSSAGLTDRPLEISECFEIEVTKNDKRCLSLGLTSHSPESIEYPWHMDSLKNEVWMMRFYSSGHSVHVNGKVVKTPTLQVGRRLSLMVTPEQSLVFYQNGENLGDAIANVPHGLYGFVDLWADVHSVRIISHPIQQKLLQRQRPQSQLTEFWEVPREEVTLKQKILGTGGWGYVVEGTFCGKTVAIKSLHNLIREPKFEEVMRREIGIMAQIRHPNLVLFIAAVIDDKSPLIITELLDISLREAYESNRIEKKLSIYKDVACALNYLHQHHHGSIIHRDVSSANVLLEAKPNNQWKAKLSDFGSAKLAAQANTVGPGAPVYAAPEVCTPTGIRQSPKVDVYSYGILLCEVTVGRFPIEERFPDMLETVRKTWSSIHTIITTCTQEDPGKRPTMANIIDDIDRMKE